VGQRRQRFLEAPDGFPVDRAGQGLGTGLLKVGDRLHPVLAPKRVMGEKLGPLSVWVGIVYLDRLGDPAMKGSGAILEQSTVGGRMGQRMVECVFGVGE